VRALLLLCQSVIFGLIGQLLDQSDPSDAEKELAGVYDTRFGFLGGNPSYPQVPSSDFWPFPNHPSDDLGFAAQIAADQAQRAQLTIRIAEMKLRQQGQVDPVAAAAIQKFYQDFASAYSSRDDSLVMSFIGDRWSAGDGTTLSDLQDNLHRIFGLFDDIQYTLQGLALKKISDGIYQVGYNVTIVGRIFKRNLKHTEGSHVDEQVSIDGSGKVKINLTLNGDYWNIQ